MDIKTRCLEILDRMRKYPLMWAYTKEAFAAQAAMLLELGQSKPDIPQRFFKEVFESKGAVAPVEKFVEPFTEEWAHMVVDNAKVLINGE